jgi:hypothetical protein
MNSSTSDMKNPPINKLTRTTNIPMTNHSPTETLR